MKKIVLFVTSLLIMSVANAAPTCTNLATKYASSGKLTAQEYKVWKNQCKSMTATDYTK